MKRKGLYVKCSVLLAASMAATLASASTFKRLDVAGLQRSSEAVVRAHVLELRSVWNSDRSMIYTLVGLRVDEVLGGNAPKHLVVRVPGGTIGSQTVEFSGAPEFVAGEDVVAFIGRWRDGVPMVAGYFQGLSQVSADPDGSVRLRGGAADGLALADLVRRVGRAQDRRLP